MYLKLTKKGYLLTFSKQYNQNLGMCLGAGSIYEVRDAKEALNLIHEYTENYDIVPVEKVNVNKPVFYDVISNSISFDYEHRIFYSFRSTGEAMWQDMDTNEKQEYRFDPKGYAYTPSEATQNLLDRCGYVLCYDFLLMTSVKAFPDGRYITEEEEAEQRHMEYKIRKYEFCLERVPYEE